MIPETEVSVSLTATEASLIVACIDETAKKYGINFNDKGVALAKRIMGYFPVGVPKGTEEQKAAA